MRKLIESIQNTIIQNPLRYEPYDDLFSALRQAECEDFTLAHDTNRWLRNMSAAALAKSDQPDKFYALYDRTLLFDAPHDFDSYLLYLEGNRNPSERFYQPRRRVLKAVVDALQELTEDKLDELFLSMPPRVGKTTILMLYITWVIGRDSERSNLYAAYSDLITDALHKGVLEVITDPVTYRYRDVFPEAKIAQTNAADELIDMGRKKRYPSLTCRSLYSTLNGACDCNGILISDDLISGIEEALNPDRLIAAWSKVDNNLLPRAKEQAKILWCGTRWSVIDPIGKRMQLLQSDGRFAKRRYRIITLPALDDKEQSNFVYSYGVGFSTDYYMQRRASFERNNDMASWLAQYMGEPIEREGTLFLPDGFQYFNGTLPDASPDRVYMAVDPAFGGGDFVAAPVCVQYGDAVYVPGVVYDAGDKKITQPLLADAVERFGVREMRIEANKMTDSFKEGVEEVLKKRGKKILLTTKAASTKQSKVQRIYEQAPDIREHFVFLEPDKRDKAYSAFMQNVFAFKLSGDNKHDDAPDSLAMAAEMLIYIAPKVEVFKRVF